ncbi:MAG: hypothetical protein IKG70_06730 [Lachnospiraceae bacterium]|nr:hypothetical protein [Erysipelotrichaceae bacterium]MBR3397520.1 hypothetical protein [Lachnospiraceae bacterium]
MNQQEMKELLKQHGYYVFGTGYVARMLYRALEKQGLLNNLQAFCRSRTMPGETFLGVPVISAEEAVQSGKPVLLGIHDGGSSTVPHADRMIRVYPYLKGWLFGEPPKRQQTINTEEIRQKQPEDQYWIAARYAGIEGIAENDPKKKEIYLRTMSMHCSKETAQRRLESLKLLMSEAEKNGLDPDRPIALDADLRIIDGLHRLAVAAWLNIEEIQADIYPVSDVFTELFGENNRLSEATLRKNGFSDAEIAYLRECKRKCG